MSLSESDPLLVGLGSDWFSSESDVILASLFSLSAELLGCSKTVFSFGGSDMSPEMQKFTGGAVDAGGGAGVLRP